MADTPKIEVLRLAFENHKVPEMIATAAAGTPWVMYGEKDNYPQYLTTLFNRSAKHNAIITGKAKYIYGNGLVSKGGLMLGAANELENFGDLSKKLILDYELYNGFAVEVIWNKLGSGIASLKHIDFSKVRTDVSEKIFYYSPTMGNRAHFYKDNAVVQYKPFDPAKPRGRQLFYFRDYRPGTEIYPLPDYIGAVAAVETDVEIVNFHLNNLKNKFAASKIINFNNGTPTEEEQRTIEGQIKKKFTGTDKAGSFVLTFSDGADKAPTVLDVTAGDLDKQFIQLRLDVTQDIFTGHKITSPMLFGIKTEGQLGGRTEMLVAYELLKATYTSLRAKEIENAINYLWQFKNAQKAPGDFEFQPTAPLTIEWSEQTMLEICTPDELRDMMQIPNAGGEKNTLAQLRDMPKGLAPAILPVMTADEQRALIGLPAISAPAVSGQPGPAPQQQAQVNDNLKNLTGKQHIQVMRIIRQFTQGKLTEAQARTLLKSGFGLNDDDINSLLGIQPAPAAPVQHHMAAQTMSDDEKKLVAAFAKRGRERTKFTSIRSRSVFLKSDEERVDSEIELMESRQAFMSSKDGRILQILKNDPATPVEEIAKALNMDSADVSDKIDSLRKEGYIGGKAGALIVTESGLAEMDSLPFTTELSIVYSYDVAPGLGPTLLKTSREFCVEMCNMNRYWTGMEIADISVEMGYDVWERRGGFWRHKGTGVTTPYCRHVWTQVLVRENI